MKRIFTFLLLALVCAVQTVKAQERRPIDNQHPLWLIHGVWVNDYTQNSHRDALDQGFKERFLSDCRTMLDVVHGNKKIIGRNFHCFSQRLFF